jgi:hypothetical protein
MITFLSFKETFHKTSKFAMNSTVITNEYRYRMGLTSHDLEGYDEIIK